MDWGYKFFNKNLLLTWNKKALMLIKFYFII